MRIGLGGTCTKCRHCERQRSNPERHRSTATRKANLSSLSPSPHKPPFFLPPTTSLPRPSRSPRLGAGHAAHPKPKNLCAEFRHRYKLTKWRFSPTAGRKAPPVPAPKARWENCAYRTSCAPSSSPSCPSSSAAAASPRPGSTNPPGSRTTPSPSRRRSPPAPSASARSTTARTSSASTRFSTSSAPGPEKACAPSLAPCPYCVRAAPARHHARRQTPIHPHPRQIAPKQGTMARARRRT